MGDDDGGGDGGNVMAAMWMRRQNYAAAAANAFVTINSQLVAIDQCLKATRSCRRNLNHRNCYAHAFYPILCVEDLKICTAAAFAILRNSIYVDTVVAVAD